MSATPAQPFMQEVARWAREQNERRMMAVVVQALGFEFAMRMNRCPDRTKAAALAMQRIKGGRLRVRDIQSVSGNSMELYDHEVLAYRYPRRGL